MADAGLRTPTSDHTINVPEAAPPRSRQMSPRKYLRAHQTLLDYVPFGLACLVVLLFSGSSAFQYPHLESEVDMPALARFWPVFVVVPGLMGAFLYLDPSQPLFGNHCTDPLTALGWAVVDGAVLEVSYRYVYIGSAMVEMYCIDVWPLVVAVLILVLVYYFRESVTTKWRVVSSVVVVLLVGMWQQSIVRSIMHGLWDVRMEELFVRWSTLGMFELYPTERYTQEFVSSVFNTNTFVFVGLFVATPVSTVLVEWSLHWVMTCCALSHGIWTAVVLRVLLNLLVTLINIGYVAMFAPTRFPQKLTLIGRADELVRAWTPKRVSQSHHAAQPHSHSHQHHAHGGRPCAHHHAAPQQLPM